MRVVYSDGSRLWVWREEADQASTLAANLRGGFLSPDGRLVAFWRPLDAQRDEIWVVGTDGLGERRLAVSDGREILERHPEFAHLQTLVRMGWVPNTRTLWYCRVFDAFDTGVPPYGETVRLVDADSGAEPRVIVPAGDVWALAFAPDARQLAALTERELRLIDTADGRVTHTVPFATDSTYRDEILYSPDTRQALVYVHNGLAVIDAASGERRDIPLDYQPLGASEGPAYFPRVQWQKDSASALVVVCNAASWLELQQPTVSFSLWRLDLRQGTVSRLQTFTGDGKEAIVSPDGRWVVYTCRVQAGDETTELYIADIESGRHVLYDRGDRLGPRGWVQTSTQFAYAGVSSPLRVGQLCGPPFEASDPDSGWHCADWLSAIAGREEILIGCTASGRSLIQLNGLDGRTRTVVSLADPAYVTYVGHFYGG